MSVQRMKLNAVARNIANANTTNGPDGQPYQREVVVVQSAAGRNFQNTLDGSLELARTNDYHSVNAVPGSGSNDNLTLEAETVRDNSAPRMVYDPGHPDANEDGYVAMPNVNIVTEMVDMISAQRAFQANVGVVDSAKNIARYSFDI